MDLQKMNVIGSVKLFRGGKRARIELEVPDDADVMVTGSGELVTARPTVDFESIYAKVFDERTTIHESRRPLSRAQVQGLAVHTQKHFKLPYGKKGGWDDICSQFLMNLLSRPKNTRQHRKNPLSEIPMENMVKAIEDKVKEDASMEKKESDDDSSDSSDSDDTDDEEDKAKEVEMEAVDKDAEAEKAIQEEESKGDATSEVKEDASKEKKNSDDDSSDSSDSDDNDADDEKAKHDEDEDDASEKEIDADVIVRHPVYVELNDAYGELETENQTLKERIEELQNDIQRYELRLGL
jgi:cobalamin biosynthesis protein CobT